MRTILSLMTASRLLQDRRGATAIEYGLIAAGIGLAIAGTVGLLGGDLMAMFENIQAELK
ncbi:MAG TPA: Flp family type IVb pilin [Nitrospira sp.]|jgi:pilus assembly protein Flp/PilA|nr:Flp family type IVb pilin [Nitrospira sp.]